MELVGSSCLGTYLVLEGTTMVSAFAAIRP